MSHVRLTPSNDRVLRGRPDGFFASVLYTTLVYYSYMHVQNLSAHALHGQLNIIIELFRFFFVVTMTISILVYCRMSRSRCVVRVASRSERTQGQKTQRTALEITPSGVGGRGGESQRSLFIFLWVGLGASRSDLG